MADDGCEHLARQVQGLIDRQEITDVLYAYLDCVDRCDFARLYESVFHPDALFLYQKGSEPITAREFVDRIKSSDSLGSSGFVQTMHYLTNILIRLDGAQALAHSVVLGQHQMSADCRDVPPYFSNLGKDYGLLIGARYSDLFSKRNGHWRIIRRELFYEWDARIDASQTNGPLSSGRKLIPSDLWDFRPNL